MNKNLRYLWLALAAILGLFVGGKWNLPLAAWLSSIFILRFFRDSEKAGRDFLLLWFVSAISTIISWQGATAMNYFSPMAEPIFFLLLTPLTLIPYVIDRLYHRRFGNTAWLMLVFPIAVTAVDFFSSTGSPFGSFGAGAYTQRDVPFMMQIASITGLWGIPFIINWCASLVNHLWENGFKFTRSALISTGILVLILGLGLGRVLLTAQPERTAVIAGFSLPNGTIESTITLHLLDDNGQSFRQVVDGQNTRQLDEVRALAQAGANIVVLQEGAVMGMSDQVEAAMETASAIAQEEGIYIVLPTFDFGRDPAVNSVHIIDPNGKVVLTHIKYGGNFVEGTQEGDGILHAIDTPYGKLSAVICWDADFPAVIKQAGEQRVDLLFIPANDWPGIKDIHAGMATFRAVENGMTIFRQTGQGVSLVSDPYGKILSRIDSFKQADVEFPGAQRIQAPIGSVHTLYPIISDAFGNVMLLGFVGLLLGLFFTRKMQSR